MKKILGNIGLVVLIFVAILILAGCSKKVHPNEVTKEEIRNGVIEYNGFVLPWRNYNYESELESKIIISNREELIEFCNTLEASDYNADRVSPAIDLFSRYDEEYFKTKSLAIVSVTLSDSGKNIELKNAVKDGNSVKIEYEVRGTSEDVSLMVVSTGFIVVEVDKDVNNIL